MENTGKMKNIVYIVVFLVVALILFVIFKKDGGDIAEDMLIEDANVTEVDVVLLESFPVQINVMVKGEMPDSCYELGDNTQRLIGDTFSVNLKMQKSSDPELMCAQAITPFDTTISLDNVVGLSAGEYTVNVNGVEKTFTLDVDNYITDEDPLK